MQIDLVITELNVGGAERALTRLAVGLQESGDQVRVFSLGPLPRNRSAGDGSDELVARLQEHAIDLTSGEGRSVYQLPAVRRRLQRWLNQRPSALCQSFLFHANVLTHHSLDHALRKRTRAWVAGVRVADPNRLRIAIERRALRRADHVVCVSAATEAFSRQHYRLPDQNTSVIANAVEIERFQNAVPLDWQRFGWPPDAEVVLFVGRLIEQKNLALLQQTLDQFVPPGSNRRLAIAGEGPQRPELQRWAEGVTGDRVRILPWQADVPGLIAASRVFVLPSHYEGMPNVVLEAMAGGKPVVCSRVEGTSELIGEDDAQGFDPGDGEQLAQRINRFLGDAEFAAHVGRQNQRRIAEHFQVQQMVDAYRQLYRTLV